MPSRFGERAELWWGEWRKPRLLAFSTSQTGLALLCEASEDESSPRSGCPRAQPLITVRFAQPGECSSTAAAAWTPAGTAPFLPGTAVTLPGTGVLSPLGLASLLVLRAFPPPSSPCGQQQEHCFSTQHPLCHGQNRSAVLGAHTVKEFGDMLMRKPITRS